MNIHALGPEQTGTIISHYSTSVAVEDQHGEVFRCFFRQNLDQLVVGDRVLWCMDHGNKGVVTGLLPRVTLLSRLSNEGAMKPMAANVDRVAVVITVSAHVETLAIDRYLVAAELSKMTPMIIFNKVDLLPQEAYQRCEAVGKEYQALGYEVLFTSATTGQGFSALTQCFQDCCSIVVGESGVGKSSLLSALLPHETIRVGELSSATKHGQHTTTTACLYHLPAGGSLIDSPGIRCFNLWHMEAKDLARGFIEFRSLLGGCKFRNCAHKQEPGCLLLEAVKKGTVSTERFNNYHRLVADFG